MVFKNTSAYNSSAHSSGVPYSIWEYTYQAVGGQVVFLKGRDLISNNNELYNFGYVFIDSSVTYNCYVINVYTINASSYMIVQYDYGNVVSNYRLV